MDKYAPPTPQARPLQLNLWWLTASLIALNVGLFLWQISTGMNASHPSIQDAIAWGADYAPLTFLAEPQRLFTSMFFHFGLIHLMMNMWALFLFGKITEQMLGRGYFIGLYVLAGLMGSLLSAVLDFRQSTLLIEQQQIVTELLPKVGAGASGAVMGLGGALTVLALLPVLPQQRFILDKKTLLIVMGINLMIGFMTAGINNTAHIGGLIMGACLAFAWYIATKYNARIVKILGLLFGCGLCIGLYAYCMAMLDLVAPLWQELLSVMQQRFAGQSLH